MKRTIAALQANGISALRAADTAEAKRIVLDLIPNGSPVHHGASQSLELAGIVAEIEGSGRYEALRPTDLEHGSRDAGRRDPASVGGA